MLRTKRYTYAVYRGWEEKHLPRKELLFDNVADPYQMQNLAELPGHATLLADFRRQLTDKMASLHDTFPESTWYEKNWISPMAGLIPSQNRRGDWRSFEPLVKSYVDAVLSPSPEVVVATRVVKLSA